MMDIMASSKLEDNLNHPLGAFLYSISTLHCMTVSLSQGGAGLGNMWGYQLATKMLQEAGFTDIKMHVAADKMNMLFICSKNAKAKL
jgi:hypothetical protein